MTGTRADEERGQIIDQLTNLLWSDLEAFDQLYDYCLSCYNPMDEAVRERLIQLGLLEQDGSLPDLTNEAMYEMRTGERPPWL